jgi:D-alanyl-lipoteichoic acid acyltransferase DltB (MBOAT superfamily)
VNLSEVEFAFFFPLVFAVYWLLPRRAAWQNAFLLAASYVFYWTWNPRLVPLLLAATLVDYFVGRRLGGASASGDPASAVPSGRRRALLGLSLAFNLGVLGFFKYSGFFAESLNDLLGRLGLAPSLPVLHLVLPLGLSYYTLQKIGYVVDVYYGRHEACRSLLDFALFTAFFPQMIAGPISRASVLLPQLAAARTLEPDRLASGALTYLVGFGLKAYVADYLGRLVAPVFANQSAYSVAGHWVGLSGFALQVFCDFAGYSLLAIGCARMLAIELPTNFTTPFLATSLFEFWRRWHISLNTWLFDYIYTPLITSRGVFRGRFDAALLVTFLASGLWHGAQATFVVWGLAQGLGLVVVRRFDDFYRGLCRKDRAWVARRKSGGYEAAAWLLTQAFFLLTLVPFRTSSLGATWSFLQGLFVHAGPASPLLGNAKGLFNLGMSLLLVAVYHLLASDSGKRLREGFLALPAPVRGFAYGVAIVFLSVFMPTGSGAFIYAQF